MVTGCDRQADVVKTAPDAIDHGGLVLVDGTQLKGISSLNYSCMLYCCQSHAKNNFGRLVYFVSHSVLARILK